MVKIQAYEVVDESSRRALAEAPRGASNTYAGLQ